MRAPTLCLVLLVGLASVASVAHAGWWDDLDRGRSADLGDVIAQPHRYKTGLITFFAIFNKQRDVYNPLATPFNRTRHGNVAIWADASPVWETDTFRHEFPFVYMDRRNPQHQAFVQLEPFTRIEITGHVKAIVRGMPMIQVTSFRKTGHRLGKQVVQSVLNGDRYAEMGEYELAYENYRRALRPDLPPAYELLLKKRVAAGLVRLGRVEEARALAGSDEILADSSLPEMKTNGSVGGTLGDPLPGPAGPPNLADGGGYLSGPPAPAPSAPIASDLPGSVPCPPPSAPGFPPPIMRDDAEPVAPSPLSADLPGQLTSPLSTDLPGQPVASAPGGPSPAPRPATRPAPPRPRSAADKIPGAPRRHNPRLTGVK